VIHIIEQPTWGWTIGIIFLPITVYGIPTTLSPTVGSREISIQNSGPFS
jgi:hypothetical protein